jgi:energy-coupling factor transport system permease protein
MDLYLRFNTSIHRLDPRVKVFGLLSTFALLLTFNHPLYVAGLATGVFALALAARALCNLRRLRALFVILFLFSVVLWPLFTRGETAVARIGPLVFTRESLLYGLAVGLRLDAMVAAGLVFLSTTRVEEVTAALRRLGLPFPASFAFSLAFRLVPTFADSAHTIIQAQQSRGLDLESGGLITRIRRHVPLLVPTVIGAVRTTNLLAMALESRGFGASTRRSEYLQLRARPVDFLVLGLLLAAITLAMWWRLSGHGAVLSRV